MAFRLLSPLLALIVVALGQSRPASEPLAELVNTERAFARLGAEKGARDSFLVYFSDDAITLDEAEPRPAKAAIRQWPTPPPGAKLLWEPRTGDIAASADLGFLTGPVVQITANGARLHACYMSVWKRQADGTFKVVMDTGTQMPSAAEFTAGFTRAWRGARYSARDNADRARAGLEAAEQALAADARTSIAQAMLARISDDTRLYRQGILPLVGRDAIAEWLRTQPPMHEQARHVEVASSGELGYAWGSFTSGGTGTPKGHFVRVWVRGSDGAWRVLIDVTRAVS